MTDLKIAPGFVLPLDVVTEAIGIVATRGERAVLQVLFDANGEVLDKQTVADRAGYEAAGGGFNGALSKLRTLELIEGSREIRISETLL